MSDKDGGPAFPRTLQLGAQTFSYHEGMSLRDYFAAQAIPMATKWEEERPTGKFSGHMEATYEGVAARAYFLADAMLKERGK